MLSTDSTKPQMNITKTNQDRAWLKKLKGPPHLALAGMVLGYNGLPNPLLPHLSQY